LLKVVFGSTDYKKNRDEGSVQKEKSSRRRKTLAGRGINPRALRSGIEGSSCQSERSMSAHKVGMDLIVHVFEVDLSVVVFF